MSNIKTRPSHHLMVSLSGFLVLAFFQSVNMYAAETNAPAAMTSSAEGKTAREAWAKHAYVFTPSVKEAYLAFLKADVRRELTMAGKSLPADFLAWVEGDPAVASTVYGTRNEPMNVLLMLRSLELDLGTEVVRKKYTQLALAAAVVFAKDGPKADLSARELIKLSIGGDPRKPVNTKDPSRPLDLNDHIINFLNENTVVEDVVVGQKEELPELKYDDKGVAIPAPKAKGKPKMIPITEKRTRTLYAADVIASKAWQEKFNAYLQAKGQSVQIDSGEKVVHWNSHDMVRGEPYKKVVEAYKLFKTAYEAKGLLPAARDPIPTPAERCAYLIRNNEYQFPAEVKEQRKWPRYPLTAPWPTLTLLVANDQPLRERDERWIAFRDKGEFRTYGEYIGGIAQQGDMQSARRLKEYPFTYGTIQMMLKDGGVCGVMANISARSHITLGVPSCTAGQPGHCALIMFGFDPKMGTYNCHGGQYATAGDSGTGVHGAWVFGDVDGRKPMVYHQSIAWAVNYGLPAYLDSNLAYSLYRKLPEVDRKAHGQKLLESGLALNPYNFLLNDAGYALVTAPNDAICFYEAALKPFASLVKPGCPTNGLYFQTLQQKCYATIGKLPVPGDSAVASGIFAFLQKQACDDQATLAKYKVAVVGLPGVLRETEAAFKAHVASNRTAVACDKMAATLAAAAGMITDKKAKREWALARWQEIQGYECYFAKGGAITLDPSVGTLARLAGQKPRVETEYYQPLLDQITVQLKTALTEGRTPKGCNQLANSIKAVAKQIKPEEQKRAWLEGLAQTIRGKEEYVVKKNAKPVRDPCAAAIQSLISPPAEGQKM